MYKIFGDWDLVLASYNSGPGNVAKAIRRSGGQQNFWNIRKYLPQETQGYVPAFLATMYIYEYHKEHGIVPNRATIKHFATDTIMIKKQISFKQISDLLDIPIAQLQLLNPQFKLNVIPAYFDNKHYLRLPLDKVAVFTSNEEKIYAYVQHEAERREKPFSRFQSIAARDSIEGGESVTVSKIKFHKVRRGDNLSEIADRYDVSMSDIKKWNKLKNNKAPLGRKLKIVTSEQVAVKVKKPKADSTAVARVEKTENANSQIAQTSVKEQKIFKEEKVISYKDVTKYHKVKKGDNLSEIASKYDVAMSDIKKWNKLKNNNISLGKSLKIVVNERVVTTVKKLVKTDNIAVNEKPKKENIEKADNESDYYVVEQGDNLSTIAKKHNITIDELKKWNNLQDNTIKLESKLKVSEITFSEEKEPVTQKSEIRNVEYIVQKGDNLGTIAKKNNVAISDLKIWNELDDDNINLGDKLIVGKKLMMDISHAAVEKPSRKEKAAASEQDDHYYVKKGDSLFSIARKYPGVSVSDIKRWNRINGNSLKPGMRLKISG
jgi:membrane-bound lytic murein transglycosylase D